MVSFLIDNKLLAWYRVPLNP